MCQMDWTTRGVTQFGTFHAYSHGYVKQDSSACAVSCQLITVTNGLVITVSRHDLEDYKNMESPPIFSVRVWSVTRDMFLN